MQSNLLCKNLQLAPWTPCRKPDLVVRVLAGVIGNPGLILALLQASCVNVGQSLSRSVPQSPHLLNGNNSMALPHGGCEEKYIKGCELLRYSGNRAL